MSDIFLLLAVFFAGMTTLGVELTASRLLGSFFGTSNLVWANIIGLILVYLSAGYFIGGRWADRSPRPGTFYRILAWGAFASGLVPLAARPVLRQAATAVEQLDGAVVLGSFLSVLVLFSVPITLLGCASPFAIRLSMDRTERAGRVSGRIYALSTLGSLLGTFLPVLWLIPSFGTARTFLFFSLSLYLIAILGLWRVDRQGALRQLWMPVVLLGLSWFVLGRPLKVSVGQIHESESAYNYIQVIEVGDARALLLNEGQAVHSVYDPASLATYGTWDYFLAAPFFYPREGQAEVVQRLGLVGLAGGTIAKQYTQVFGPVPIDGWEIDPRIVEVGRTYFDMNEANLNVHVSDGRWGLARSEHLYSVIAIDAYRPPYIPWHLTTKEFFAETRDHLLPDGVLAINVGRTPEDRRLIDALVGTIGAEFATVHVVDVPGTFNTLVFATVQPTNSASLAGNLQQLRRTNAHPLLIDVLERTIANLKPTPRSEIVFTDDRAPVERLVDSIVLRFLLGGGFEQLPSAVPNQ